MATLCVANVARVASRRGSGELLRSHAERGNEVALAFTEIEVGRGAAAQGLLQESPAAIAAQIEAAGLIGVVFRQLAVGVEFLESLEDLIDIFEMIAVAVDWGACLARRGIHCHPYHKAYIVIRIELTLAQVAAIVNHLAINPFLIRAARS
jgi:hypothetical protein